MSLPITDAPVYLYIKGFARGSAAEAQARAEAEAHVAAANRAAGAAAPQSRIQSAVRSLREWREFLGDPPTLPHPLTHATQPVPLDRFSDRDPDEFMLRISWRQYNPKKAASLPPPGEPIIEIEG